MDWLFPYLITIPLIGFSLSLLPRNKAEKWIFAISLGTVLLHLAVFCLVAGHWAANGFAPTQHKWFTLYDAHDVHDASFTIVLFFDQNAFAYALVTIFLTLMVMVFSRYYIHREKGFRRFFNNILFFYLGLMLVLFSGNFETLFVGWEFIGISSFFLIAFYRDRYLPVKNALKVVSLYRVADIFLLLGVWICHHYFARSISFAEMGELYRSGAQLLSEEPYRTGIPLTFLVVTMVKSAQLPFSSWLPRAMEGPTTSSAIFYGSLSVHIGIFLLIRTYPMWAGNTVFEAILIALGVLTSAVATVIARVQSTVKTQIAYSSIAQIGLMVVEVALGWHGFALFHFAGNAFLRTYQLLVSPSVLSYQIHDQFFHFIPPQHDFKDNFWGRLRATVFVLSIKEWNLDRLMYRYLWMPLKAVGNSLTFVSARTAGALLTPLFFAGMYLAYHRSSMPAWILAWMPNILAAVSILLTLKAFVKRNHALNAWILVVLSQLFVALAIAFNEQFAIGQILLYLSGIVASALLGYGCIRVLEKSGEDLSLDRFQGHSYEHPRLVNVFLVASLGLIGFPITPTFVGEDVLLGHVHENQYLLTTLIALTLILDGLAVFRLYARVFLGPHEKGYHEVAYRSS